MAAVLLLFFLALIPASAQSFFDNIHLSFSGSLFYFAANNGKQDADSAPITPSLGLAAGFQLLKFLRIELTEDLYFKNYEYNSGLGYPMTCSQENRSAFVFGFLTGANITGYIPLGENGMIARFYGGPAADIRIVALAFGLHPDDFTGSLEERDAQLETNAIREYFWSNGRWFFPVAGIGMDFPVNEKILLGFDIRAWFPLYRLWTDEDIPAIDGWRFGIGFRITPRKANLSARTNESTLTENQMDE